MILFFKRTVLWTLELLVNMTPGPLVRALIPYDYARIQKSFEPIRSRIDEYSPRFYENFWNDYPETRPLFGHKLDYKELHTRINHFMLFTVENAHQPGAYISYIRHLSRRHTTYGIRFHQFEFVCETNLKTLKEMIGDDFSKEDEAAWRKAFEFISNLMSMFNRFR